MEQAHHGRLAAGGAGLGNGADQHLQQAAAKGVDHHSHRQTGQRGDAAGQHSQQNKAQCGKQMGGHHAYPPADLIHKTGGQAVHAQLHQEIDGNEQGDLVQREGELPLEGEKEQRGKEVDDRLDDVPGKAGSQSSLIAVSHKDSPPI